MNLQLQNDQELTGACFIYGNPVPTCDDSYDPTDLVYLYRDADERCGLVRASTWEDARESVLDEILRPILEDEVPDAYGFWIHESNPGAWELVDETTSRRCCVGLYPAGQGARNAAARMTLLHNRPLVEGYEYQSNATGTGIVRQCLNGERLAPTSRDELQELGIVLILETDD